MFVTDKLIYLQMEKTGCTHIASLLSNCVGGTQIGKHNILKNYQTEKFIVGSVRNPWTWYVSLWAFGCSGKGGLYNRLTKRNPFLRMANHIFLNNPVHLVGNKRESLPVLKALSKFKLRELHEYIHELMNELKKPIKLWNATYQNYNDPDQFKKWLKLIYNSKRKIDLGERYWKSSVSEFAGLMTYRYCRLYLKNFLLERNIKSISNIKSLKEFDKKHNILDYTIRTESLEENLIQALRQGGYDPNEQCIESIYNSIDNKINKSKHYEASFYHDKETINMISEKEKFIIDKCNYSPP